MKASRVAMDLGGVALALIAGALGFQYFAHFPPCEMCHWQRWPLFAAIALGLGAGFFARNESAAKWGALLAIAMVAASGGIGAYQAGVEWHWWQGPSACTGARVVLHGLSGLNDPGAVRCDVAAWRLFGISLAGYNALISLGSASLGLALLMRKPK